MLFIYSVSKQTATKFPKLQLTSRKRWFTSRYFKKTNFMKLNLSHNGEPNSANKFAKPKKKVFCPKILSEFNILKFASKILAEKNAFLHIKLLFFLPRQKKKILISLFAIRRKI